jgi:hypothetical protein
LNNLTRITIPNGIDKISDRAFAFNKLERLTIPDNIVEIGEAAFQRNSLTGVTLPQSVRKIGRAAFYDNAITRISIGNGVECDNYAFGQYWISFIDRYNKCGKKGGTYICDQASEQWKLNI